MQHFYFLYTSKENQYISFNQIHSSFMFKESKKLRSLTD